MTCKNLILFAVIMALTAIGCEDSYNDRVDPSQTDYVNNDNPHPPTALDTWLSTNFTHPYNIEVKYRWDASELDLYKAVVPPKVTKVQDVMEVVKSVWIDTYAEIAGDNFIKQYCPKQFVLVGSASYNFDGSITLGTAEGGRKVVLYVVNDFQRTDEYAVKEMMHTIEHEFAHILHQNISYPAEFKEITPGDYTANWNITSLGTARAKGFITSYAMASPDEDFVEMVAMMLVEGKEGYESILDCETNITSKELIKRKEKIVVEYFKESYNIDFYALQTKVQEAIHEIAPGNGGEEPEPLFDLWGFGKAYTTVRFDLSILNEPADFIARYNYDNNLLHNEGYSLDYNFKIFFTAEEAMTLRLYYYREVDGLREYSEANLSLQVVPGINDSKILRLVSADENGMYLLEELGATGIISFFVNRAMVIDWASTCSGETYVGFTPVGASDDFAFGILSN
jgi:substrate import-associated zinc metallohydrolase lipoprotein